VSSKSRSIASAALEKGGAPLATDERPDMVGALMGRTYPRGQWLFLYEGITVPIVYHPAPTPPPPPTP
jgi:hypothetical protein